MTFNRYMAIRAVIELVGACSCLLMAVIGHDLVGAIIAAAVAVVWSIGEIWTVTTLRKANPRRDELSDLHQGAAMQSALLTLVAVLVVIGFIYTVLNLMNPLVIRVIPPMILPALAMAALALSDVIYLWLEHDGTTGGDDED